MSKSLLISSMALLLLSAPAARADDADGAPELKGPVRVEVQAEATATADQQAPVKVYVHRREGPAGTVQVQVEAKGPKRTQPHQVQVLTSVSPMVVGSGYWIGLACSPARASLRAQLGLPEDQGLVVEMVVPDSPAAKAKIKRHDVLLNAGDKPLGNVPDLIDAIQAAKHKEVSIELIRGGKRQVVTIVPAKPPEDEAPTDVGEGPEGPLHALELLLKSLHEGEADEATQRALKYLKQLQRGEALRGPLRWRFVGPGAILPPGAWPRPPLPGNMSITITKKGDQPAKITVKQGGEKWEVTEEELDKLPDKVRPHVEGMLGRVVGGPKDHVRWLDFVPDWRAPLRPEARPEGPPETRRESPPEAGLQRRLEEMNRQIERLHKSIEELRERRPRTTDLPDDDS